MSSSEPEPDASGLPSALPVGLVVTETTEPLASVTVVVTEPSALVALDVVSLDEDADAGDADLGLLTRGDAPKALAVAPAGPMVT